MAYVLLLTVIFICVILGATCAVGINLYNSCNDFGNSQNRAETLRIYLIIALVVAIVGFLGGLGGIVAQIYRK